MKGETLKNVTIVSVVAMVMAIMLDVGIAIGKRRAKVDAVKNGHARWVPDEDGGTTFEWMRETPCKPKTEERKESK